MKRQRITLECIAERKNLLSAFQKAAKGKRYRGDVQAFLADFDSKLNQLGADIRQCHLPYGRYRSFQIYDPKQRLIHAACFEDRVFHHALMNQAGGVLERAMVEHSYACRPNKGVHKAVLQVQKNLQRFKWYCKIDISAYFTAISHSKMLDLLMKRFKGDEINNQFKRVLDSHNADSKEGLPIGSLTSQYFANFYLDGLDRLLNSIAVVRANVRYMDDIIWWCDSRKTALTVLQQITKWLCHERGLQTKQSIQVQPSSQGVTYCGFRILQGTVRLSRRRKRRFQQRREYWESCYLEGLIDAQQLQLAHTSVQAITHGTDSLAWRRENLRLHPAIEV